MSTEKTTPRDLIRTTYDRFCNLISLRGSLEEYLLLAATKLISFGIGIGLGYWLWGMQ